MGSASTGRAPLQLTESPFKYLNRRLTPKCSQIDGPWMYKNANALGHLLYNALNALYYLHLSWPRHSNSVKVNPSWPI